MQRQLVQRLLSRQPRSTRLSVAIGSLILALAMAIPALAQSTPFPAVIPLPNGWQPEGVVIGHGQKIYAGSLATGAIYAADLRTGEGEIAVPEQEGRVAAGLAFDKRTGYLFAAGAAGGAGYVYNSATGESLAAYQFTDEQSFVNDVVVTKDAVYFTDSSRPYLYRVPLGSKGELPAADDFDEIELTGDFEFVPDAFNANGIAATPNGDTLIIVQSSQGKLYNVDPATGEAQLIDLGGADVTNGDGILLLGKTLYVVQNMQNQIAVVELDADLLSGEVVGQITSDDFRVPTTIDRFGTRLYAVNARFDTQPQPDTEYEIVGVDRHLPKQSQ